MSEAPWHYESDGTGTQRARADQYVVDNAGFERVCTVHGDTGVAYRRARMIAATPQLLRAAKEAVRCITEYDNWPPVGRAQCVKLLIEAIEKAERK